MVMETSNTLAWTQVAEIELVYKSKVKLIKKIQEKFLEIQAKEKKD